MGGIQTPSADPSDPIEIKGNVDGVQTSTVTTASEINPPAIQEINSNIKGLLDGDGDGKAQVALADATPELTELKKEIQMEKDFAYALNVRTYFYKFLTKYGVAGEKCCINALKSREVHGETKDEIIKQLIEVNSEEFKQEISRFVEGFKSVAKFLEHQPDGHNTAQFFASIPPFMQAFERSKGPGSQRAKIAKTLNNRAYEENLRELLEEYHVY